MNNIQFCAPCLFGIEGILADELKRMDAGDVQAQNGRVLFTGDESMLARANINSRYAERIQIVLGEFEAKTFDALFEGTKALEWERFIGKNDAFPVKGWSLNSTLHSVPDCQAIVKKAIAKRLGAKYHTEWLAETDATVQVQFTIMKDRATLLLDTSGVGLHKRGYRAVAGGAPIKETLAAAIVDLMRGRNAPLVCDPCCGSGTLLIESALAAYRIAPGIRRRFAAMNWSSIPESVWREERVRARDLEMRDKEIVLRGGDIDPACVELAMSNAQKAGVDAAFSVVCEDLADFVPQGDRGLVLCNPPYGERLLDVQQAESIYRTMGKVFRPKEGWQYAIISPHEQFEDLFGRKADKRRKLYNGMLKCQLFMYFK